MNKARNKKVGHGPKKEVENGICSYHLHNERAKVYKCKYCKDYFCEEHLEAKPPSIPDFKSIRNSNRLMMEEWHRPGGHPCAPYFDFWIAEEERRKQEYRKAIDNLVRPQAEVLKVEEEPICGIVRLPPLKQEHKATPTNVDEHQKHEVERASEISPIPQEPESRLTRIKCFFGFHSWQKLGGPSNIGNGKFEQKLICSRCRTVKSLIN